MTSMADSSVNIQTSAESVPAPPSWFGEVVLMVTHLRQHEMLTKISERVRFARRRFGHYEVIDFLAVLFGYAISGERTLEEFYLHLQPFAGPFMALFERERLPSRSALSRFLAALTEVPVEALRTLFLEDLQSRPLANASPKKQSGGLADRAGTSWLVIDLDGTREAARQRALPQGEDLPPAFRRLDEVCAPGYRGRKRGQVVRTRTVISQAHSSQWLGSFGNRGNGRYREELRKARASIDGYLSAYQFPQERTLLRLDGQYGTGAVLADLAGFAFVTRGKDYTVLDHPLVQARLHLPPDQTQQRPESQVVRSLYDLQMPVKGALCDWLDMVFEAGALVGHKDLAGFLLFGAGIPLFNGFIEEATAFLGGFRCPVATCGGVWQESDIAIAVGGLGIAKVGQPIANGPRRRVRIHFPLLVSVGLDQPVALVGHFDGFVSRFDEESMDFCRESRHRALRRVSHLDFMSVNQVQKYQGLQLDQRSLFWQQRCRRLTQIEQGPPLAVPVQRRVGLQRGEVRALHPSKRRAALVDPQQRMCFGSGSVQVEGQMLMVFEPGRIQICIQAIACNEGVHIIHAQLRVLCPQG